MFQRAFFCPENGQKKATTKVAEGGERADGSSSLKMATQCRCSVEIEHKFYIEMPDLIIRNSYHKDRLIVMVSR